MGVGRSHIDGADAAAVEAARKWGEGRLRLLVSDELREKFDRQYRKFSNAIRGYDLQAVITESNRMVNAYAALDRAATQEGCEPLKLETWEATCADGVVLVVVRSEAEAHAVHRNGRAVRVMTLQQIAALIDGSARQLADVVTAFPGARVVEVRHPKGLEIHDAFDPALGDDLPF
jgi:hypothetical protein